MPNLIAGQEFIVTETAHDAAYTAGLVNLANGNYLVTFYGAQMVPNVTPNWLEGEVYGRIYDSTGNPVSDEFVVNDSTTDDQFGGQAIALSDGGFLVSYVSSTIADQLNEYNNNVVQNTATVFVQRFNAAGVRVGSPVAVANSDVLTNSYIVTTNSGYNVYWMTYDENFNVVSHVQAYTMAGATSGAAAILPLPTWPSNITNVGGTIIATYPTGDVQQLSLGASGMQVGTPVRVNTYTIGTQTNSSLAVLNDGSYVIAWQSRNQDGDGYGVYLQRFNANGTPAGSETQINTYTTLGQTTARVAALSDGGFIVVWVSNGQDGDLSGVFGQQFDASGAKVGAEFPINVTTAGAQYIPFVSGLDGGGFAVYWQGVDANGHIQLYERTWTLPGQTVTGDDNANTLRGTSGGDTLIGLGSNDVLYGLGGNDTLDGGTGNDSMFGGSGSDIYVVDSLGDKVSELTGGLDSGGTDTVRASVSFVLGAYIENLTLTGASNLNGTGNALDNIIIGNAGNNTLNGGLGADNIFGGAGNDVYVVDNLGDVASEETNAGVDDGGTDTVLSSVDYSLGAFLENLTLTGAGDVSGIGNSLNNIITGNAGTNWIDGGTGRDRMSGGTGDDTYVVDNTQDVVVENADGGNDTILSSVTLSLVANVENLTLTGTANINALGNGLDNTIIGNDGNNILNGGIGADIMSGGAGNDTYYYDNEGDWALQETWEGGNDTVISSVSHALSSNIESITLTGTGDLWATGNELDNVISGTSGANRLDGGAGADRLTGGLGNDTYVVDTISDVLVEGSGGGVDTAEASISWSVSGTYIENILLVGSDNIDATGSTLANLLMGNMGNNRLDGGAGTDTMVGGAGDDTYVVDNAGDIVTEGDGGGEGEGTDTVMTGLNYSLGDNVENLTLTGTASASGGGNGLDNVLTGNGGRNALTGGDGADTLRGMVAADTLTGGDGADDFVFEKYGTANGIDHVTDFVSGMDHLVFLAADYGFEAGHVLTAAELVFGGRPVGTGAQFLYNTTSHLLSFDSNGVGGAAPVAIAYLDNAALPALTDFVFI